MSQASLSGIAQQYHDWWACKIIPVGLLKTGFF